MTDQSSYIPGMCNINQAEIAYRRKAMWIGIGISVAMLAIMFIAGIVVWVRILLFIPVFIAVIGYLQSKNKFCVAYGASGKQNATDGNETAEDVIDETAKQADKRKARTMNLQAAMISLAITLATLLLPSF